MRKFVAFFLSVLANFGLEALGSVPDSLGVAIALRMDSIVDGNADLLDRTQLGLYVYDLTADSALYAHGHRQRLRPASTEKLVTSITALTKLGGDYAYRTTLSALVDTLHSTSEGGSDTLCLRKLIVKGGMDPTVDAQTVSSFVNAVKGIGKTLPMITPEEGAVLAIDLSFKDSLRLGEGWCWDDDDAPLVPLLYGEDDTFAQQFVKALEATDRRGKRVCKVGRIDVSYKPLKKADGEIILLGRNTNIDKVLVRMMKNSDNKYAESMFYQLGPTASKAAGCVKDLLKTLGADVEAVNVADGSGLSLYNYTTPETLVLLLRHAWRTPEIYRHLQPSLPLAGHDGTLASRMKKGPARHNVMAKTGTVTGVSTLAGYALADNGHMLAFAIMNQGVCKSSTGRAFQDTVCQALCAPLVINTVAPEKNTEDTQGDPLPLPARSQSGLFPQQGAFGDGQNADGGARERLDDDISAEE